MQWMSEQKLDLAALNAMITRQYSAAATPELFNFLSNIYHSSDKKSPDDKQDNETTLWRDNLCRNLANGFHIKQNVFNRLVIWLEVNDKESTLDTQFTLKKFWKNIQMVLNGTSGLHDLEVHKPLVIQCQKLSQYILIAKWAELTEQDIDLLMSPKQFNDDGTIPSPSLHLLYTLSEFKRWQQQVKIPLTEVMSYLTLISADPDDKVLLDAADQTINDLKEKKESLSTRLINYTNDIEKSQKILDSAEPIRDAVRYYHTKMIENNKNLYKITKKNMENLNDDLKQAEVNKDRIKNKITNETKSDGMLEVHNWDVMLTKNIIIDLFGLNINYNFRHLNTLVKYINTINHLNINSGTMLLLKKYITTSDTKTLDLDVIAENMLTSANN